MNYGIYDIIADLDWVLENMEAFGDSGYSGVDSSTMYLRFEEGKGIWWYLNRMFGICASETR